MNDGNVHGRTHGHDNKESTMPWATYLLTFIAISVRDISTLESQSFNLKNISFVIMNLPVHR